MLDEKDLQAIAKLLEPLQKDIVAMQKDMVAIKEDIAELKEAQEEIRSGVNALIEWAEDCGNAIKFPLPRIASK